jgi:hypothetical protein
MERPRALGRARLPLAGGSLHAWSGRLTFIFGLSLAISALTGWYSGTGTEGTTVSVTGWHTGTLGKIVLFLGLVAVLVVALREFGFSLPAALPDSLVAITIGSAATVLVLVRLISIPDTFFFAGRGFGIWLSLVCALGIIVSGLLAASEEL